MHQTPVSRGFYAAILKNRTRECVLCVLDGRVRAELLQAAMSTAVGGGHALDAALYTPSSIVQAAGKNRRGRVLILPAAPAEVNVSCSKRKVGCPSRGKRNVTFYTWSHIGGLQRYKHYRFAGMLALPFVRKTAACFSWAHGQTRRAVLTTRRAKFSPSCNLLTVM